jgi:hypothetical protein
MCTLTPEAQAFADMFASIVPTGPRQTMIVSYDPAIIARVIVQGMARIDLFDYLADYAVEPSRADHLTMAELRVEVILDIQSIGADGFCKRMIPAGHADVIFQGWEQS